MLLFFLLVVFLLLTVFLTFVFVLVFVLVAFCFVFFFQCLFLFNNFDFWFIFAFIFHCLFLFLFLFLLVILISVLLSVFVYFLVLHFSAFYFKKNKTDTKAKMKMQTQTAEKKLMSVDHRAFLAVSRTFSLLGLAFYHASHHGYTNPFDRRITWQIQGFQVKAINIFSHLSLWVYLVNSSHAIYCVMLLFFGATFDYKGVLRGRCTLCTCGLP